MSLRYRTLDTAIAQTDMAMDRTARENPGGLGIACISTEVLIRTIRRGKVKKIRGSSSIGIGWTEQNVWRGKLIAHINDVWRKLVIVIQGPNPNCETKLLEVIDAVNRRGPFTGLIHGRRFFRGQR